MLELTPSLFISNEFDSIDSTLNQRVASPLFFKIEYGHSSGKRHKGKPKLSQWPPRDLLIEVRL